MILAVPFLIPFTVPLEDTVATFLLLDLYVIFPDGVAFAVILVVFPTFTDEVPKEVQQTVENNMK